MNLAEQEMKLQALRADAVSNADALRADLVDLEGDGDPTESHQPTDNADNATTLFERERDGAMVTDFDSVVARIDRALAKIKDGTYGTCERCGKPIPQDRLEAYPDAEYDLDCQQIVESE